MGNEGDSSSLAQGFTAWPIFPNLTALPTL